MVMVMVMVRTCMLLRSFLRAIERGPGTAVRILMMMMMMTEVKMVIGDADNGSHIDDDHYDLMIHNE